MIRFLKDLGLLLLGVLELLWELITISPDKESGRETSINSQDLAALEPGEVDPHGTVVCGPESPDANNPSADRYTGFAKFVPPPPTPTALLTGLLLVKTVMAGLLVLPKTVWEHLTEEGRETLPDDHPTIVGMLPGDEFIESEAERLAAESAAAHRRVEQRIASIYQHTEESTV